MLIPVLLAAIFWSNPIGWWLIVIVATALSLHEFYGMTMPKESATERMVGVVLGTALGATIYWRPALLVFVLGGVTMAVFLYYVLAYRDMQTVAQRIGFQLAGFLYAGVLPSFVALLKTHGADGGWWVLITLTLTWMSDTGAYFAGRFLGKYWPRKLYEAVSPKKTLIGACGGMAASILALVIAKLFYLPTLSWLDVGLIAVPANVLGQLGDLCESLLKRSVDVKDSGKLLPGHGGMLDRIDALIFTAPYVFMYATFFYRG